MALEHINDSDNTFCNININKLPLIGEGRQGRVYLLPENKVIKVYKNKESFDNQISILQRLSNSGLFPKLYEYDDISIVMEFIDGIPMNKYLQSNRLNKKISLELVELISQFKRLGFTRLDIRISHIFIQKDESLRVIDPRGCFNMLQTYPLLMLRGLREFDSIDSFFKFIREIYPRKYMDWRSRWDRYNSQYGQKK